MLTGAGGRRAAQRPGGPHDEAAAGRMWAAYVAAHPDRATEVSVIDHFGDSAELRIGVAESVDDAFAWDEGEDDRSRASWLVEHRRYWEHDCAAHGRQWTEDTEIVFERFAVVWPPELTD